MFVNIRHINVEVTKRCNQHCVYCFNNSGVGSRSSELKPEMWLRILHELRVHGLESMHLTGGEPFAYPYSMELLGGAQDSGLHTSILSNGFRIEELASAQPRIFSNLVVAQISLDSMNPETLCLRRGHPRAWHDAMSAIDALRNLHVPLEISCVVSEANVADVLEVADFCQRMDAALLIRPMLSVGRATAHVMPASFDHTLKQILGLLGDCNLVSDRFRYVTDEQSIPPDQWREDIQTVHYDGRLRLGSTHQFNLQSILA
ncbi:MAG TPA: radical SAM protein [Blastocatellia bacterium]|nr:radical SAM protein [Blastocatellia bacterium]